MMLQKPKFRSQGKRWLNGYGPLQGGGNNLWWLSSVASSLRGLANFDGGARCGDVSGFMVTVTQLIMAPPEDRGVDVHPSNGLSQEWTFFVSTRLTDPPHSLCWVPSLWLRRGATACPA
ncbi:hypothetical protein OPV22_011352 [Ensete ventricosum]|uniref:Uncharacterized protein n=1 Tax=Ensete ventricosum TaxID=4639 RepID=A0AAV8PX39_ENSVE|nr:hypothetical protein OPV22_011352 [Ensete ventricosum]